MVNESPLRQKSYAFALRTVLFCKKIVDEKKEYVMSRQLLRSATSIGANVEEAQRPESRKDFVSKLSIAMKEAYESRFWLRIIFDSSFASETERDVFLSEVDEIIRLLGSSIATAKRNADTPKLRHSETTT